MRGAVSTVLLGLRVVAVILGTPAVSGESIKLTDPVPQGNRFIGDPRFSADGSTVTYNITQTGGVNEEVYAVPIDGSSPAVKVNGPLVEGGRVRGYQIVPDGSRIVYAADQEIDEAFELYSGLTDGSAPPIRISRRVCSIDREPCETTPVCPDAGSCVTGGDPCETHADCSGMLNFCQFQGQSCGPPEQATGFALTPDGNWIVFYYTDLASRSSGLYRAPIDGSSPAVPLTTDPVGQFFYPARFTADSTRFVFLVGGDPDVVLYSVPVNGSTAQVPLVAAPQIISHLSTTPDGATMVYAADADTPGVLEVYAVPTDGSAPPTKLSAPMAGAGASAPFVTADGARVYYEADQDTADVRELYSVPLDGSEPPVKLNHELGSAWMYTWDRADGAWFSYTVTDDGGATFSVWSVPVDGSAPPVVLEPSTTARAAGTRGKWIFYFGGPGILTLLADGSGPAGAIAFDGGLEVPESGKTLFGVGFGGNAYTVPISADLPPFRVNGDEVPWAFYETPRTDPTESWAVYTALEAGDTGESLFSRRIDSDHDGTPDADDNCPRIPNPGQEAVVFDGSIVAESRTAFGWQDVAVVEWVRGSLDAVASYATDVQLTLEPSVFLLDTEAPVAGAGFYYLVRFGGRCTVGSWQTAIGAEPGRDAALP